MYCNAERVRNLCVNVKSTITDGQLEAASEWADDVVLDPALSAAFSWPIDSQGFDWSTAPPKAIVSIANMLVAYRIETRFFAQNEAGINQTNPYALGLKKDALTALDKILTGETAVLGLEINTPIRHSPGEETFSPVTSRGRTVGGMHGKRRRDRGDW